MMAPHAGAMPALAARPPDIASYNYYLTLRPQLPAALGRIVVVPAHHLAPPRQGTHGRMYEG